MDVNSIGSVSGGMPIRKVAQPSVTEKPTETRPIMPKDVIEIGATSSVSGSLDIEAEFRAQRIAQIQEQIEAGTYETPEKLDAAVDRLLDRLLQE